MYPPCGYGLPGIPRTRYTSLRSAYLMGKPPLTKEEKRSVNFTFRLTEEEQKKLFRLSEITGQVPGVLIREKLFKGRFPEPKKAKLDLDTYLELKRIGVNVNQLAKHANAGRMPVGMSTILKQLVEQLNLMVKLLLR
jgi:hypothetical protein